MVVVLVVVIIPLVVGDVVGDDDRGRGAICLTGAHARGTCKCPAVYVHALLFLPNNFKSLLNLPKYLVFNTGSAPVSDYLQ